MEARLAAVRGAEGDQSQRLKNSISQWLLGWQVYMFTDVCFWFFFLCRKAQMFNWP